MTYLLNAVPTCGLYIDSVRLLLQGDVKLSRAAPPLSIQADPLVPDIHYQSLQEEYVICHQYNSVFLAGILEVLMSHGTSSDKG